MLRDLQVVSHPLNMKKWFWGYRLSLSICVYMCMSVCTYVSTVFLCMMYAWVAHERLNGLYSYQVLQNVSIISRCLVNMDIIAPKIWILQLVPKKQSENFLESCADDFY
jgi:hypothetical protein